MTAEVKTVVEILNQPEVWQQCLKDVKGMDFSAMLAKYDPRSIPWLFVGCGTSFYLAQGAAASFTELLASPAGAVPASEILLNPKLVFPRGAQAFFPVLISRSGHTSEVLQVADYLTAQGVEFLAVTCDGRELAEATEYLLKLNVVEESTVMTSSFTTMLLSLQYIAASVAGNESFLAALTELPRHLRRLLKIYADDVEAFAKNDFEDIAILGQGALYPIAEETALKVMESSSTYAQFFHTLEFRHGPKSVVGPATLVGGLLSESNLKSELQVLLEMKQLGAKIYAVVNEAPDVLRVAADLLIELEIPGPELARLAAYVVWGQLLGSYRGLEKGLDPDNPRNLSRVVTI
ncbi:glucosamine--fructose-6-phosphate aminotransferase (isomerizing) [Granulicella rosea]|uniref:Glucosamine--fructose-6-phosphate aminotransferase (Isomerizing) n=1 Tax=Granulicella rosea TaxID=474952 RepID=A0A239MGT4_9BACT|nr:SIS domain-containing protein [Granulicella rosea]SNT41881.1 glucosamine--fructose-6-phosphate aminotransferase (isomerizing) [Granulicella rosea]